MEMQSTAAKHTAREATSSDHKESAANNSTPAFRETTVSRSPLLSRLVHVQKNNNNTRQTTPGSNTTLYASIGLDPPPQQRNTTHDSDDDDDSLPDDWDALEDAKHALLAKAAHFDVAHAAEKGYRATELKLTSWQRPHMRAFHASWLLYFCNFMVQFSPSPLLPEIQRSLQLNKADIWWTNLCMMVGGIPARFVLGPVSDQFGARVVMVWVVVGAAGTCALTGLLSSNLTSLTLLRFVLGATDAFVPCQYWITCQFVREVGGTAMAVAGGLGASGSGVTQLLTGSLVFPVLVWWSGDADAAWRWSLVIPAIVAIVVAAYFYGHSDDCPLGNYHQVKKAGLMLERSAVDSFRAGLYNLNAWILAIQFAGACGVDFTMCNGAALYFHETYGQSTAAASAMAFLYGISAVYARGVGGWLSDAISESYSLQGRLWAQLVCMLTQGLLNVWFARAEKLGTSLIIMVVFSIAVQMSMGTCYGIVPYVDGPNTGSVAGIVGAGGNVGAVVLARLFMVTVQYETAMEIMGWLTVVTALLTPLIVIKGYRGLVFGHDESETSESRKQHSPLLVPGKMQASPHLVALRRARAGRPARPPARQAGRPWSSHASTP